MFLGGEQIVAPGDGVAHRLQPERPVAAATGEQRQAALQSLPHLWQRQVRHPRRGQLDGQRYTIEPPADVRYEWGVVGRDVEGRIHRLATLREELRRRGLHQFLV